MGEICDGESDGRFVVPGGTWRLRGKVGVMGRVIGVLWCLVGHGVPLVERKGWERFVMGRVIGVLWCLVGHGVPLVERKGGRDLWEIFDGESDWRFVVPGGTWSTVS